ncbi:MAG TPA: hypothetical protein VIM12_03355 [Noviherbaspirillum sp.]|uniref:hypothetical protein n=1 Tax=Noviherbaspirillum sp. TaxID=1926288 RepID=UPI002F92F2DE
MRSFKPRLIAVSCAAVLIAACGGGGGSDSPTAGATPAVLSGTAAAGAALAGNVTVKDATGKTKTVPIGAGGGYSVDVSDMTAPFVLRATGSVGGRTYVLHSVATDATKTINVTPLTDLIVANVAGQLAANFFDNPDTQKLSATAVAEQQEALKQRLLTVLTALGVDAAIDLMHTSFTADHTKLDAALDILRVSVDPDTNIATIKNVITKEEIQDNLASKTDSTKLTDTTNISTGLTDLQAIVATMKSLSDAFAKGLPSEAALDPLVHADMLHHDEDKAQFIAAISGEPENTGIQFTNIELQDLSGDTAKISFDVIDRFGGANGADRDFLMKKVGGKWQLYGNRYKVAAESYALAFKTINNGDAPVLTTGLEFWFEDRNSSNSANVDYAVVKGPGLPSGGVRFDKGGLGGSWRTTYSVGGHSVTSTFYPISSDTEIAKIPRNALYEVKIYNADDTLFETYTKTVPTRPYTNAELANVVFPTLTAPDLGQFATFTGGEITVSGKVPTSAKSVFARVELNNEEIESFDQASNGSFGPIVIDMPTVVSPTRRTVRASYIDPYYREIFTVYNLF